MRGERLDRLQQSFDVDKFESSTEASEGQGQGEGEGEGQGQG